MAFWLPCVPSGCDACLAPDIASPCSRGEAEPSNSTGEHAGRAANGQPARGAHAAKTMSSKRIWGWRRTPANWVYDEPYGILPPSAKSICDLCDQRGCAVMLVDTTYGEYSGRTICEPCTRTMFASAAADGYLAMNVKPHVASILRYQDDGRVKLTLVVS